jgi:hypothetical protein
MRTSRCAALSAASEREVHVRSRKDDDHASATSRDTELEATIAALLDQRGAGKTICPSDAARAIGGDSWRDLMEPARQAARRMVARGEVVITQHGQVVDPSTAKGPIRIRRA